MVDEQRGAIVCDSKKKGGLLALEISIFYRVASVLELHCEFLDQFVFLFCPIVATEELSPGVENHPMDSFYVLSGVLSVAGNCCESYVWEV
jgi:hypothetical protein